MNLEEQLRERSNNQCELCLSTTDLSVYEVPPEDSNNADNSILLCVYIMEMLTTLFRAKLTQGLADFWVAANAIKARTKIVI
jgi:hypothetical protein